jgi:hypothetical protein
MEDFILRHRLRDQSDVPLDGAVLKGQVVENGDDEPRGWMNRVGQPPQGPIFVPAIGGIDCD